jgi:DNA-binding MarR family transcriptional regulator
VRTGIAEDSMADNKDILQLSSTWIRILNKMDANEKCPRDFGSGDLIHCSEIHTMMVIGKNPDITITNLAAALGITKSAISQMITRLAGRNLVEKRRNPDNEKEILLRLTPRGTIAYLGHEQYHAKIYARMQEKLGDITDEQFRFIAIFLGAIEETADEFSQDGP